MNICILTHGYPRFPNDPTAPFIESIAETLQKYRKMNVTVLTPDTPKFSRTPGDHSVILKTYRYFFPRQLQGLGYANTLVNDCRMKRYVYLLAPFFFVSGVFHLFHLHHKHHFDVIHAHWLLPNGFIGAVLSKIFKIPLVITLHGSDIFVSKQNPFFKMLAKWTLKQTSMVTSVTPAFMPDLAAFGVPRERRCLIPNGINAEEFSRPPQKHLTDLRKKLEIPADHLIIFALGRIVLKKGFDILIQAFPCIQEKVPQATLLIGGDGSDLQRLKALAKKKGVSDRIRFPGSINRLMIPKYFHLCDLFVLPAIVDPSGNVDGCPIVILEAMACGKPVVASQISGIPVVVKDGKTGILVAEKNVEELAGALITLLTNHRKREQLGQAGQQRILKELTWNKITKQFKDVYQDCVNHKN